MRFPLSWLREWIDLPESEAELKELFFKAGIELESVERLGASYENVVVARVEERQPHPNADRLSLCKVSDGTRIYTIVCGAPNVQAGIVVPLAREGAVLPGDFKIKKSKIRGQESEGMLCSAKELGLSEDAEGLMILDPALPLGQPLARALSLGHTVFTIQPTANRADHNSILGLARELAALTGKPLRWPNAPLKEAGPAEAFKVEVADAEACPLYSARILRGLKVGPSPACLVRRLEACGARGVNNVVDATNYVLFELGQPLHAFDLAKLSGNKVVARRAVAGEKLVTLDQTEVSLTAQDLVIADAAAPRALAGVMGGLDSGVGEATTSILLESAVFQPAMIRRTAKRLRLHSESSYRFERGVDPQGTLKALDRAASVILELAGGAGAKGALMAGSADQPRAVIAWQPERVNQLLGTSYAPGEMAACLKRRGFEVRQAGPGWEAVPPSYRQDVAGEADLAEEIAQVAGLETVPATSLQAVSTPAPDAAGWQNAWLVRGSCVKLGLQEAATLSYLDPAAAGAWGLAKDALRLDNPISEEQSLLRPSLLPNLVASAAHNLNRQVPGLALFEWGKVFGRPDLEEERLAVVLAGQASVKSWNQAPRDHDFFDLKGLAESLARDLGLKMRVEAGAPPAWLHPGQSASLRLGPLRGWMGALHPGLARQLGLKSGVYVLELGGFPHEGLEKPARYRAFTRLPGVGRDLSCLVPLDLAAGQVLDFFAKDPGTAKAGIRVIDLYQSEKLPAGKKSLTFSIEYQPTDHTLTDEEVNGLFEAMAQRLEKALPVSVRRQ